jgi:hypothetical protein
MNLKQGLQKDPVHFIPLNYLPSFLERYHGSRNSHAEARYLKVTYHCP